MDKDRYNWHILLKLEEKNICRYKLTGICCISDNAKWFLNVQWAMEGVDIHLDVNIGKQLSALGHTLTTLTSYQEDDIPNPSYDSDDGDNIDNPDNSQVNVKHAC